MACGKYFGLVVQTATKQMEIFFANTVTGLLMKAGMSCSGIMLQQHGLMKPQKTEKQFFGCTSRISKCKVNYPRFQTLLFPNRLCLIIGNRWTQLKKLLQNS